MNPQGILFWKYILNVYTNLVPGSKAWKFYSKKQISYMDMHESLLLEMEWLQDLQKIEQFHIFMK